MALARYARQSLLQWADVPVTYIRRSFERLARMIEREGASAGEHSE